MLKLNIVVVFERYNRLIVEVHRSVYIHLLGYGWFSNKNASLSLWNFNDLITSMIFLLRNFTKWTKRKTREKVEKKRYPRTLERKTAIQRTKQKITRRKKCEEWETLPHSRSFANSWNFHKIQKKRKKNFCGACPYSSTSFWAFTTHLILACDTVYHRHIMGIINYRVEYYTGLLCSYWIFNNRYS